MISSILILFSILFLINGIILTKKGSITAGVYILYTLGISFFTYGHFYTQINFLTSDGILFYFKILVFIGLAVYILIMIFILSNAKTTANYTEDIIIILGAGVINGNPTKALENRLKSCIEYYKKNKHINIIVTGGLTRQKDTTESAVMKDYLVANGIPSKIIFEENYSQSTKENYVFSNNIIAEFGLKHNSVAFITNSFHIFRGKVYANFCGFKDAKSISSKTDTAVFLPALIREVLGVLDMFLFKLK